MNGMIEKGMIKGQSEVVDNQINGLIKNGIDFVRDELKFNPNLREKVIKKVVEKKIVDEFEYDYDISEIKLGNELKEFLDSPTLSDITKKNYKKWINNFFEYCNKEKINFLKIKRCHVDNYLSYLGQNYSSNSVRSYIMGICSFYKFLIYRYPKLFSLNPFHGLKLPKIRLVRRIDIVCDNDVKELKKEFKRIGRDDIICVIDLICKYGFRIGIFENMKIDDNGNWKSVSKGSELKGKFNKIELKRIKSSGILNLSKSTIQNIIQRYSNKLFKNRIIGSPFSVHDLRHYYITKNGKDLTIEEFIKFSRKIHKNISTTLSYINL
jgi:site-specific recombinase XerD